MVVTPVLSKAVLSILNAEAPQRKEALAKLEQPEKTVLSMLVRDAGRVMCPLRPEFQKAALPMVSSRMSALKFTEVKLRQ